MRLSQFFLPLLKETPAEAQIVSHRLMLRAGLIRQVSAGIYAWLPLGLRVLANISRIVREEQDKAGGQELLMPTIQPAELWRESGRYDAYGKEMLRITDRGERELLYGPTNEEVITDIFRHSVKSYKALPKMLYHIQWKFRDEIRPRFGVMRGREFLMKDGYSFDIDYDAAKATYARMYEAYHATFARLGLTAIAVQADTGAVGGDLSHEFHILAENGESAIYYDARFDAIRDGTLTMDAEAMRALYAAADEKHAPAECPLPASELRQARGIEVGHIFYLGKKYSSAMQVVVAGPDGAEITPEMGCYGIGVSRLMGAIIESSHDANGIVWPDSVAPFQVGLITLRAGDAASEALAEAVYATCGKAGVSVLYDDTSESAGKKFSSMDLIGLPWQIIIGPKNAALGRVELKRRKSGECVELSPEAALARITGHIKSGHIESGHTEAA